MNGLKMLGFGVVNVTGLGEDLEDRGSQPPPRRFVPLGHVGITAPTVLDVVCPEREREAILERLVLLPNDEIKEVARTQ